MSRFAARLASLCFYCLIGCGTRALALDHAAPAESATTDAEDPFVSTGSVSGVWIDEQRLYWLASESSLSVQSCRTPDCERTTLSYARSQQLVSVAVADGRVYWTSGSSLFSCTAEGCQGKPLRLAEDPAVYGRAIFARRDYIYWSSDFDIYRCRAQGCAEAPEIVVSNAAPSQLAFDEERVYWLDRRGIMSAPSDGSELPKLVIKSDVRRFAIGDGYLYWTPVISGQEVFRCPIADCASATTRLVKTDAPIVNLRVDGSAMYWIEANAIHSCPLTGCEQSLVLTPPNVADLDFAASNEPAGFALDAGYLYWLEAADPLRPGEINYPHGKAIRRTAR